MAAPRFVAEVEDLIVARALADHLEPVPGSGELA
jgi:hypothetical protein